MSLATTPAGRVAIPRAARGTTRGGASARVLARASSSKRDDPSTRSSHDDEREVDVGIAHVSGRLARSTVSLVASLAVLAPIPGAIPSSTIERTASFDVADEIGASSSRRHHDHLISIGAAPANALELDPWKEGRARKAAQRAEFQRKVDEGYAKEAENREEKERLQTAYYAKASASRKARLQAQRNGATEEEAEAAGVAAGQRAFDMTVQAIDAEAIALQAYEQRNAELRATAEERNAEQLAAEEAAREVLDTEVKLSSECVINPLDDPGAVMCT